MNIQKIHIEKFKELYKKEYGVVLSNEEAIESCHKLVNLVKAVYKPVLDVQIDIIKKNVSS